MKKDNAKIQVSFKNTTKDLELYVFLMEVIKDEIGISTYIKGLIRKDMETRK